jgi:hypothetical protein
MGNTKITKQDCDFLTDRLNIINDRIFEICELVGCPLGDCSTVTISTRGSSISVIYPYTIHDTGQIVAASYNFPIDWLLKTDREIKEFIALQNAIIAHEKAEIEERWNNDDLPF